MASFGNSKVVLPSGSSRPGSPSNGTLFFNTTENSVEVYTSAGWKTVGGAVGTSVNPASSGSALYAAGITENGNYYLDGGSGSTQYFVKMDNGGGWINVNTGNSVYSSLLTSGTGTGGSELLGGSTATGTDLLNGGNATQAQALTYGCPGATGKAYLDLNSTFASDFSISEVRLKILYVSDDNSVTCGPYWTNGKSNITIISGSSTEVYGVCANPPNRYSDLVGTNFTVEFYGDLASSTRLLEAWTACGGSYTMRLLEVYVR